MQRNRLIAWWIFWLALPLNSYAKPIGLPGAPGAKVTTADWSYQGERGPQNWGNLSPAYALCQSGSSQSPVDLMPEHASRLAPLRFHYRTDSLNIGNDGLSIRMAYAPGSYLQVENRQFELKELVFRTPGEHTIEGRQMDMEVQLLHRSSAGVTAILAIPVSAGVRRNAMLQRIWDYLPTGRGTGRYYRYIGVNPVFFLPADRSYFRYTGSLTEPPCTERITWFVMQKPVEVSVHLIDRIRQIMGHNNRPVQATNGRSILTSR